METIRDLGNNLILRPATPDDTDALVEMQIHAFANPDTGEPDIYLGGWTRDLMSGKHPTFKPHDFLVVKDTKTGAIVSCTCLISQTWTLDGISFAVGRVEIVGTAAAYRRRGLVRAQFDVLHEWSAQRGEMLQAITGIPYYYRQFGYEFAIELVAPRQTFVPQQIPELKEGEQEKFRLRHAEPNDLPFIAALYKQSGERSYIYCQRDETMFEYENFLENNPLDGNVSWWDVIETLDGTRVGILMHRRYVYQSRNTIQCYEILPEFSWLELTPCVMRELVRQVETMVIDPKDHFSKLGWFLQSNHPLFQLFSGHTAPLFEGYAWYIRVPDVPAFLLLIAPILEKRLAGSNLHDYSDTLRLNFYDSGIEMTFDNGKLISALPWLATAGDYGQSGFGNAIFPPLTFLKLLFGYRSRAEVQAMFPDCIMDSDKTTALIDILFPKQTSNILPIH